MIRISKKFGIGMIAVMMAVAFSAFTAPNQSSKSNSLDPVLYWYEVDQSGPTDKIPQNSNYTQHGTKDSFEAPCDVETQTRDCMRGFEEQLNTSGGDILAPGEDQIKGVSNN